MIKLYLIKKAVCLTASEDLAGLRFGRLTVLCPGAPVPRKDGRGNRATWVCLCDCGTEKTVRTDRLKDGKIQSCGCLRAERSNNFRKTHGESGTKLYGVWEQMRNRCYKPNATHFNHYGGRGISVCDEWKDSYIAFRDWAVSNGYQEGLTIERLDNDGNYCPENCAWVTSAAQANNRRSNRRYTYNGETHNLTEWAHIVGVSPKTMFGRIYSGMDFEKAITFNI